MIRELKQLQRFSIGATDGPIGKVTDAYFDDSEWVVRYLIVDTGTWLSGRKVLMSPLFIDQVDWDAELVRVTMSRERVKDSPDIDFDKPVSRQQEALYYRHFQSFGYWAGPFLWGRVPYPGAVLTEDRAPQIEEDLRRLRRGDRNVEDSHLRSATEVRKYQIQAVDGSIGHVEDFLFDDETWRIESLLVDTRNWLPGRPVMVPPDWIEEVDWLGESARVKVNRDVIRQSPKYTEELVMREDRQWIPGEGSRESVRRDPG
jgi:sporulation protein YlmC with PRC-barrel domain